MPSFAIGDQTISFTRPYLLMEIEVNGYFYRIPDCSPFWGHPDMWRQWESCSVEINTVGDLWEWIKDAYRGGEGYEPSFGEWMVDQFEMYFSVSHSSAGQVYNSTNYYDTLPLEPSVNIQASATLGYHLVDAEDVPTGGAYHLLSRSSAAIPTFHVGQKASALETCPEWMQREMNWSFVPDDLTFLKTKRCLPDEQLFFGMELEVSTKLSRQEIQHIVTLVEPKQEAFFFFKSDSSIGGRYDVLTEIVTMPMTVRYAKQAWSTFMRKLNKLCKAKGETIGHYFDVSDRLSNGLHIHLSKSAFDPGEYRLESHKKRFITAWNLWDRESQLFYQKISKRMSTPRNSTYYHTHPSMDGRTLARRLANGPGITSRNDSEQRHSTCHETSRTVELRIYQGVFNLDHILACIDVTKATFEFTRECPISKFNKFYTPKFKHWLSCQPGFKHAKEAMQCV